MLAWLIRHRTTVFLAVLFIFVFGAMSYLSLPREGPPDVNIPVVLVSTVYPGVAPEDVESLVTDPLENELATIKDVDTMKSTSGEGISVISLEFKPEVVIEDAIQKVRDRVSRAKSKLPTDVQEPNIREISFEDFPVLIVTLAGDVDPEIMKKEAEILRDDLERIPGVLDVNLSGGSTRQVRVQADPERLAQYGLSLADVSSAIGLENANIPSGTVRAGDARYLLRVPGELRTAADVEEIAVKRVGDRPVLVRDLASVVDGFADRETFARLNGKPAVSLSVTKRTGSNIVEIADEAARITSEKAKTWPAGLAWRFVGDQSRRVKDMVHELQNSVLLALILVVSVSFVALGVRNSVFVALAIPLSLFITFNVLDAMGITLNMIVLFSLILVLGMLLDDAIVVVENIYRHLEAGYGLSESAVLGTQQVAAAVISSTATTVAAFFPLVFWTGIMGQFMGFLPRVVIISLTASLGVAVIILPVVTSRFMKRSPHEDRSISGEEDLLPADTLRKRVMLRYRDLLVWSIDHRYRAAGLGVVSLLATFVAFGFLNKGVEFFPSTEPDRASITVKAPDGTDVAATDLLVRQVEGVLAQEVDVALFVAETGTTGGGLAGSQAAPDSARVNLEFRPHRNQAEGEEEPRKENSRVVLERIRKAVETIPGAVITVDRAKMGPPTGAAVGVEVVGKDFAQVGEVAQMVQRVIAGVPGVTNPSNDYRVGRPEMRLLIDRVAAKKIGASTLAIASEVRMAVAGSKATSIKEGDDDIEVRVELDPASRKNLQDILALKVSGREDTSPRISAVPLSSVARFEMAGGSGAIKHIDRDKVVTISADVAAGFNENAVREEVDKAIHGETMPDGSWSRMGGASEQQDEAQAFLSRAFLIGLALILVVLILHFNSLSIPVIILSSVILSLIGVLWGLILTGTPFGIIMTGLGVISLAGVVTKNAIVLLDYVKKLEAQGLDMRRALIQSGITRFRPVILTAAAAVIGLVPMALGLNFDPGRMRILFGGSSAEMWGPMAIAIIFGLTVATVLTLIMVPTLYSIWHDLDLMLDKVWGRLGWAPEAPGASPTGTAKLLPLLALGVLYAPEARALGLAEVLAAADAENADLQLLDESVIQAEAQKGKAWATIAPKVAAKGTYTLNKDEITLDFGGMLVGTIMGAVDPSVLNMEAIEAMSSAEPMVIQARDYFSSSLTVTQPLFNGAALPGIQAVNDRIASTESDRQASRQRVRAGITRIYYGLVTTRKSLDVSQAALRMASDQRELAQRMVTAGSAPARTLLQADIAVARAERDVSQVREALIAMQVAFRKATNLSPDAILDDPAIPPAPSSLDAALRTAREHRVDLVAARQRESSAAHASTALRWGWAPTLDGTFIWNYTENTGFSDDHFPWMLLVSANWSLWDGGFRVAQQKEAASAFRSMGLMVEKKSQDIEEEVRNAWARHERAGLSYASMERELEMAEENVRLAETGFQAGSATWIEVDAARTGFSRAQLGLLLEAMNRDLSTVDLLVAEGIYDE